MKVKNTLIRQVYDELKSDSRKGDFFSLVTKDMRDLKISLSEEEIQSCSKGQWKNIVKRQVKIAAFDFLQR